MSVKNKFNPPVFNDNTYLKSSTIFLFNASETLTTFPSIVCLLLTYLEMVGNAFCIRITESLPAIFPIKIVLHEPYFFFFFQLLIYTYLLLY